jgi:hypothetical protein
MEYYGRSEREDKKEHNFVIKFLGIARLSYWEGQYVSEDFRMVKSSGFDSKMAKNLYAYKSEGLN